MQCLPKEPDHNLAKIENMHVLIVFVGELHYLVFKQKDLTHLFNCIGKLTISPFQCRLEYQAQQLADTQQVTMKTSSSPK